MLYEFDANEKQIQPQVDGFVQRRKVLNDCKRIMNEYRQTSDELDKHNNDVKRSGTFNATKKTADEKISILDNDIKHAHNLKFSEQRFAELRRIFNRADVNHLWGSGN